MLGGAVAILLAAHAGVALAADLKVGANIGTVPWEFQDASGNFVGFEIELMTEVGKRLGKTIAVVNIPFWTLLWLGEPKAQPAPACDDRRRARAESVTPVDLRITEWIDTGAIPSVVCG